MEQIVYFENNNQKTDYCSGKVYSKFIDYAFTESDYFMLVYVNYNRKGYTKSMKMVKELLTPYKVKSRNNPSWPGTLNTYTPNSDYKIVFYKNDDRAKAVLKRVCCVSEWSRPINPEDLAFFKKNKCWFYSVGHEKIAAIINPTEKDIEFIEANNIPSYKKDISQNETEYYMQFDEKIE